MPTTARKTFPNSIRYTVIAHIIRKINLSVSSFSNLVTDADGPNNAGAFTFEIRSGNVDNAFRINGKGSLRTNSRFSHKVRDHYVVQIVVFDNGSPLLYSDCPTLGF